MFAHDEVFEESVPDEVWLARAGTERWIVLSADKAIRRKPDELAALVRHGVRVVFVTSGNLKAEQQSALLVSSGRRIQDVLMSARPPAAFSLTKDGKLTALPLRRRSA